MVGHKINILAGRSRKIQNLHYTPNKYYYWCKIDILSYILNIFAIHLRSNQHHSWNTYVYFHNQGTRPYIMNINFLHSSGNLHHNFCNLLNWHILCTRLCCTAGMSPLLHPWNNQAIRYSVSSGWSLSTLYSRKYCT